MNAMELRRLQYFLSVAERLSYTRAAAHLHIAQSALSRQIVLLEEELDCKLFQRSKRGVTLTQAGEALVASAAPLVRQMLSLKGAIASTEGIATGTISVGLPPSLRAMLGVPALVEFRRANAQVSVRVEQGTTAQLRELLASGRIDLAVLSTAEPPRGLRCTALLSEQLVLVGPRSSALSMRRAVSADSLANHPLVVTPPRNSLRILVERAMGRRSKSLRTSIEATLAELILDLVEQGQGYSALPYCAVDEAVEAGRLAAAPIRNVRIAWVIATSRERPSTIAQARFAETLARCAHRQVSSGAWPTARLS
jgi:LysR family transcriptional regulator, nitrogen assimilation regulatory protein